MSIQSRDFKVYKQGRKKDKTRMCEDHEEEQTGEKLVCIRVCLRMVLFGTLNFLLLLSQIDSFIPGNATVDTTR